MHARALIDRLLTPRGLAAGLALGLLLAQLGIALPSHTRHALAPIAADPTGAANVAGHGSPGHHGGGAGAHEGHGPDAADPAAPPRGDAPGDEGGADPPCHFCRVDVAAPVPAGVAEAVRGPRPPARVGRPWAPPPSRVALNQAARPPPARAPPPPFA